MELSQGFLIKKKTHYSSYQYCMSPVFPPHLRDKQKRSLLCFRIDYSSSHTSRKHTGDISDKCISAEPRCICTSRTTIARGVLRRAVVEILEALRLLLHSSGALFPPSHAASQWEEQKKTRSQGQSPDTFPSNFHCRMCSFSVLMACHFARAFGQELNLESKQIFRGSNLPSSIDFFTLTEPVLPNLT